MRRLNKGPMSKTILNHNCWTVNLKLELLNWKPTLTIRRLLLIACIFVCCSERVSGLTSSGHDWTNSGFPDLRGQTFQTCKLNVSRGEFVYVCDPDEILNFSQRSKINTELEKLAKTTPCPCQRRSQCSSGGEKGSPFHGFIVSIALVKNLQMNVHSPSEKQLTERATSFCKALEGRWALGDCANSVLIFVWQHYKKIIIWPARLSERYVTPDKQKEILAKVIDLVQTDQWFDALSQVIEEVNKHLKGDPEERIDTGTLSLIIAVGVASLLTILITCCVCAFRCCGNLSPEDDTKSLSQNESSFTSMNQKFTRNIQHIRRSASHSPKFPVRNPSNLTNDSGGFNFIFNTETSVV
ncbi:hypothetical protein M3Y97_00874200 [Aphelenchoides bicaudatus]|nr:hypothetical protein M3Y97_00874200 [Aphelenchoides bicaudatus]